MEKGYNLLEEPERLALVGDLEGLTVSGALPAATAMKILPEMIGTPGGPESRVGWHVNAPRTATCFSFAGSHSWQVCRMGGEDDADALDQTGADQEHGRILSRQAVERRLS